jgi:hypothetical protein
MNQSLSITSARSQGIKEFNAVRIRAQLNAWLAKILMQGNGLRTFVGSSATGLQGRRLARTQRIRVEQIVGTVRYTEEFDKDFRPLNEGSRDRWVQAFVRLNEDRWRPIVVHKVGESYYVAKGDVQVSVARCMGIKFIEAEVWDHSNCQTAAGSCMPEQEVWRQRKGSFSTN